MRNVKNEAKVSECFRTKKGAQTYLTITSYLSTARKHGINAFAALTAAFKGEAEKVLGEVLSSYASLTITTGAQRILDSAQKILKFKRVLL